MVELLPAESIVTALLRFQGGERAKSTSRRWAGLPPPSREAVERRGSTCPTRLR